MKIINIITISFTLMAIIAAVLGSYYFYYNSEQILKEQVHDNLESTAKSRAAHIETYLNQNIERLKLVTSRTKLRNTISSYNELPSQEKIDTITKIITDAKEPIEEFERVCIIGLDGIVMASTNDNFCGKDVHDKHFFLHGKEQNVVHFVEEEKILKLFVTGPIHLDGKLIGVGITVVNADELREIVNNREGLGQTGEVLVSIWDNDGEERFYLFERLFEEEAIRQNVESEQTALPMKEALEGNEKLFPETLDYRDKKVIAFSQFIETGEIGLVAKIDVDEALGIQQKKLFRTSMIIIFSVLLFFIFLGYFVSNKISKPLIRLTGDVDKITKGKLDIQLEKSGIKEIQELTGSLNRILASMKLAILRTGMSKEELGVGEAIKARKQAEQRFKALFESSRDAIMTLSPPDWKFTSANKATLDLFKVKTQKQFISLGPWDVSPKKQPDGNLSSEKAKKMIEKAMKGGSNYFEWTHKKLDGKSFLATVLLTKVRVGDEEFLQATVRDIDKKRKDEKNLKKKAEELQRFAKLAEGRELEMTRLKKKIKDMEAEIRGKRK